MAPNPGLDTQLIHAGEPRPRIGGAANVPVFLSSVFEHEGGGSYHDIPYPRLCNLPNHEVLRQKLRALEGAEDALVTASGAAAITTAILTVLEGGGHLLVQDCLYGGTAAFVQRELPGLGMHADVLDARDPASWASRLRPSTRAIFVEAMTNPLLQVIDHGAVLAFARAHRLTALIDATFATPVNWRPCAFGYDLALHSATKYLNGHSDLVAGVVAGKADLVARVKGKLALLGGCLDPFGCWMLYRGLRTLGVRVRRQNDSALAVARFLAGHAAVQRVHYPGLPGHPDHAIARELLAGFGGVLSFELRGGEAELQRFWARLQLPIKGPSLGGVDTLISRPARLSHAGLSAQERQRMGIGEGLLRMSIGLEDPEDLLADLRQALQ